MHLPIAWSDVRPTDEEFAAALVSTRLRAHRLVAFVRQRRAAVVNLFRDGVLSASDESLLSGVPPIPAGEPMGGQFFPLLYQP